MFMLKLYLSGKMLSGCKQMCLWTGKKTGEREEEEEDGSKGEHVKRGRGRPLLWRYSLLVTLGFAAS